MVSQVRSQASEQRLRQRWKNLAAGLLRSSLFQVLERIGRRGGSSLRRQSLSGQRGHLVRRLLGRRLEPVHACVLRAKSALGFLVHAVKTTAPVDEFREPQ